MITEDYVSFETAKLLKEKGYKGSFDSYYNDAGCVVDKPNFFLKVPEYQYYERVSLQMAMKWLREVHNLLIVIDKGENFYAWQLEDNENGDYIGEVVGECSSYEEACEAAIEYCLTNLI